MAKGLETYLECSVKYDRNGNVVLKSNGEPEVSEVLKECRLDQTTFKVLNDNWLNFKKFYVKKEEIKESLNQQEGTVENTNIEKQKIDGEVLFSKSKQQFDIDELSVPERFESKIATMTKKEICAVLDELKVDYSGLKFETTKKDDYAKLIKQNIK